PRSSHSRSPSPRSARAQRRRPLTTTGNVADDSGSCSATAAREGVHPLAPPASPVAVPLPGEAEASVIRLALPGGGRRSAGRVSTAGIPRAARLSASAVLFAPRRLRRDEAGARDVRRVERGQPTPARAVRRRARARGNTSGDLLRRRPRLAPAATGP